MKYSFDQTLPLALTPWARSYIRSMPRSIQCGHAWNDEWDRWTSGYREPCFSHFRMWLDFECVCDTNRTDTMRCQPNVQAATPDAKHTIYYHLRTVYSTWASLINDRISSAWHYSNFDVMVIVSGSDGRHFMPNANIYCVMCVCANCEHQSMIGFLLLFSFRFRLRSYFCPIGHKARQNQKRKNTMELSLCI